MTASDANYYEPLGSGGRALPHWRDPFLWEQEGWIYHAVCASRRDGTPDARGTLGLARSRDMRTWEVLPPPVLQPLCQELEVPQIHQFDERFYLIFSTHPSWFSASFRAAHPRQILTASSYVMVAPSAFGPFEMLGSMQPRLSHPVIPFNPTPIKSWLGKDITTFWVQSGMKAGILFATPLK